MVIRERDKEALVVREIRDRAVVRERYERVVVGGNTSRWSSRKDIRRKEERRAAGGGERGR